MILKPKTAIETIRAVVYKRFTDIERTFSTDPSKITLYKGDDNKYFTFDKESCTFLEYTETPTTETIVQVHGNGVYYGIIYRGIYFVYMNTNGTYSWQIFSQSTIPTLTDTYEGKSNIIAQYGANKYYFAGTFDFMYRGGVESVDSQPLKGAIIDLTSLEIKYYDDNINLDHDDMVVVSGRLFQVESTSFAKKYAPKPIIVARFVTLTSIK